MSSFDHALISSPGKRLNIFTAYFVSFFFKEKPLEKSGLKTESLRIIN